MEAKDSGGVAAIPLSGERPIRAAEMVAGQPLEHVMRTAVLAVRFGVLAGVSTQELVDTYYVALLHSSGCTSDGHEATQANTPDDTAARIAGWTR